MSALSEKVLHLLWSQLGSVKNMVLATVNGNAAAARTLSFLIIDKRLYAITLGESDKAKQMRTHPQVELCVDALRIAATATFLGHPNDPANASLVQALTPLAPWLKRYESMPTTQIIEFHPMNASVVEMQGEQPIIYTYSFKTQEAAECRDY